MSTNGSKYKRARRGDTITGEGFGFEDTGCVINIEIERCLIEEVFHCL